MTMLYKIEVEADSLDPEVLNQFNWTSSGGAFLHLNCEFRSLEDVDAGYERDIIRSCPDHLLEGSIAIMNRSTEPEKRPHLIDTVELAFFERDKMVDGTFIDCEIKVDHESFPDSIMTDIPFDHHPQLPEWDFDRFLSELVVSKEIKKDLLKEFL